MLLTLALVVLCTAIVGFFAHEFNDLFKRILSKPGMLLCLPLLIASSMVSVFEYQFWLTLMWFRGILGFIEENLVIILPFTRVAERIVQIIILTSLVIIPLYLAKWFKKKYVVSDIDVIMKKIALYGWLTAAIVLISVDIKG